MSFMGKLKQFVGGAAEGIGPGIKLGADISASNQRLAMQREAQSQRNQRTRDAEIQAVADAGNYAEAIRMARAEGNEDLAARLAHMQQGQQTDQLLGGARGLSAAVGTTDPVMQTSLHGPEALNTVQGGIQNISGAQAGLGAIKDSTGRTGEKVTGLPGITQAADERLVGLRGLEGDIQTTRDRLGEYATANAERKETIIEELRGLYHSRGQDFGYMESELRATAKQLNSARAREIVDGAPTVAAATAMIGEIDGEVDEFTQTYIDTKIKFLQHKEDTTLSPEEERLINEAHIWLEKAIMQATLDPEAARTMADQGIELMGKADPKMAKRWENTIDAQLNRKANITRAEAVRELQLKLATNENAQIAFGRFMMDQGVAVTTVKTNSGYEAPVITSDLITQYVDMLYPDKPRKTNSEKVRLLVMSFNQDRATSEEFAMKELKRLLAQEEDPDNRQAIIVELRKQGINVPNDPVPIEETSVPERPQQEQQPNQAAPGTAVVPGVPNSDQAWTRGLTPEQIENVREYVKNHKVYFRGMPRDMLAARKELFGAPAPIQQPTYRTNPSGLNPARIGVRGGS